MPIQAIETRGFSLNQRLQGAPKDTEEVIRFLVAGLTLFAPYAVNKFASLFQGLAPKR